MKREVEVNTPNGPGIVDSMWISELDYFMVKVYFPKEGRWVGYNLGKLDIYNNPLTELIMKDI